MRKQERQELIKTIILENGIKTQEDLLAILEAQGIRVTQATISRDIQDLKLIKERTKEGYLVYRVPAENKYFSQERLTHVVREVVFDVIQIEFVLVIRTAMAQADVLGALLDELSLFEMAGTLAGTDTLIVFARSVTAADRLKSYFMKMLGKEDK